MTPKEKAKELVDNHKMQCRECGGKETAKIHALIAVDEILQIQSITMYPVIEDNYIYGHTDYWQKVKQEIDKL